MEENEGKNLAAEKKIKAQFDENVINLVHRFKEGNMSSFEIGNVQVDIKKADKMYVISFAGYNLCSVDDNDKITYNISELEKFKEKAKELMENGMPDLTEELGLPDIEYLKYLEKEKNKKLEEGKDKDKEQAKEEKNKDKEDKEEKEKDKDKEEDEEEKPKDKKRGLKELNLGVLILINPKIKECSKAYLDPSTNSLVFKDRFGKEHGPEEYGFTELQTATGNFELSKMHEGGEITSHENPTRVYAIKGSNYGISIDFGTHHREANLIVRDREHGHENSYSIINGNLTIGDSGIISQYRARELSGIKEGIYSRGEVDEANETAKDILENQDTSVRENFQKGFVEERRENDRINGKDDLKRAIADVLEKEYNEEPEDAIEISAEIVENGKNYYEVKAERENSEKQVSKEKRISGREAGGFGPWDRGQDPRRG